MALTDGSSGSYSGISVAQGAGVLAPNLPPSNLEPKLLDYLQLQLTPCEPAYRWDEEISECVPKILPRTQKNCDFGFKKNGRMNECRRAKYEVNSQQKGIFRQWWDRHIARTTTKAPKTVPIKLETTVDTGEWYGYGYDFGRNDPHW
ncbi:hypothetical protein ACLKA7_013579 [Drosophila subpalustris]